MPGFRRVAVLLVKSVVVVLLVALVAGLAYERIGASRDLRRLPRIGRAIDIGGRSINLFCSGEGSPTIVLISGNATPGYAWSHVQPRLSWYTRTCWFDRAGEGWSDPGPFPRTSAATAADLH